MNNFKKTGGFTLVELIVVIAILGILAAVAVPAYSGYIGKAHEAADITQLDAIKTAAMACAATEGAVEEVQVTVADGQVTAITAVLDVTEKVAGETEGTFVDQPKKLELVKVEGEGDAAETKVDADFKMFYGSETMPTMQSEKYANGVTWYAGIEAGDDGVVNASVSTDHESGWVVVEAADDDT